MEQHLICLLWFLTDIACKLYYLETDMDQEEDKGRLNEGFLQYSSRFFLRYKSRISMAIARGAARRAMLWGVGSKGKRRGGKSAPRMPHEVLREEHIPMGIHN